MVVDVVCARFDVGDVDVNLNVNVRKRKLLKGLTKNLTGFKKQEGSMEGTWRHMMGTCSDMKGYEGNIEGNMKETRTEHQRNMEGHEGHMKGTSMEHEGNMKGT